MQRMTSRTSTVLGSSPSPTSNTTFGARRAHQLDDALVMVAGVHVSQRMAGGAHPNDTAKRTESWVSASAL
jgi:hypothetical protein